MLIYDKMNCNLTPNEVSFEIKKYFDRERISLRDFCNNFNLLNSKKISKGEMKPLNKDFLLRIKNNEFKVVNKRVLDLCDFLGVEGDKKVLSRTSMTREFQNLEKIALEHPSIEKKLKSLLAEMGDLLTTNIRGEK
ncbi:hypothetical protein [Acinetobacter gyllenbergii]|uniref:hypothetical protein n=1 Tax=Acinetobacter gyllenbergii TaxID=134534 RepID=UPI0003BF6E8F|nr:hypothetical protein [Acinetobacter gyllenbergii]ESK56797.1 hypothetical protein F987_00288 [Acinetobacter gyllenbergii NIPH 230]